MAMKQRKQYRNYAAVENDDGKSEMCEMVASFFVANCLTVYNLSFTIA